MDIYFNGSVDPCFNLAAEEYLADTLDGKDVFMLWRNSPAVIIGRNQNAYTELDLDYASRRGIAVVRRLTGGGAVFHDLGNVNYTFISPRRGGDGIDFARFCGPVVSALRGLGLDASLSGRNDITVNGLKVSGSAQCVRNGNVIHHGTLLWSADLSEMAGVLRPDPSKLSSKGIKSVRGRVGNMRDMLPPDGPLGRDSGAEDFMNYLLESVPGRRAEFTEEQIAGIRKLALIKYSTREWNLGERGDFSCRRSRRFPYGRVEVSFEAANGRIVSMTVTGDFFGERSVSEFARRLASSGTAPEYETVLKACGGIGEYISGATPEDFASLVSGMDTDV